MRDEDLLEAIGRAMRPKLAGEKTVVFCSHGADAPHWRHLLAAAQTDDVLVLAFDDSLAALLSPSGNRTAAQLLADRHALLATLATDSPLSTLVDQFDPDWHAVLLITDPLNPPVTGGRPRLGGKHPSWSFFEHKSVVDVLWDSIGLARAESAVYDEPSTLWRELSPRGSDLVYAAQQHGEEPSAGGENIRWSSADSPRREDDTVRRRRVRVMPMLAGAPCRLHGVVLVGSTMAFTPLEILVPRRPADGAFLCAGTAPMPEFEQPPLLELTRSIGEALRDRLDYRGGFSVDGILTRDGFRPTDLNTRVTSAFESAPPPLRVAVHASALLAQAGLPGADAAGLEKQAHHALNNAACLSLFTVVNGPAAPAMRPIRWNGPTLVPCAVEEAHGTIGIIAAPRGTVLRIRLRRQHLPAHLSPQEAAVLAFRVADELLGAGLGDLQPPPSARRAAPTQRSGTT